MYMYEFFKFPPQLIHELLSNVRLLKAINKSW